MHVNYIRHLAGSEEVHRIYSGEELDVWYTTGRNNIIGRLTILNGEEEHDVNKNRHGMNRMHRCGDRATQELVVKMEL